MVKAITSVASGERRPAVLSDRLRSFFDLRYVALLTSVCTYALIVLGGTVRVTDSGLACPDWPRCHGQWIPPMETSVLIEFSHRLAAASVGILIVALALIVWRWHRDNRLVVIGATAAVVVLIAQVLIGGVTVNMELPDTIVALHLGIALVLLALLVATTVLSFRSDIEARAAEAPRGPESRRLPALLAATALATFVLIIVGSYVANSGAALIYSDWPLFNGKVVSAGGRLADLHYAHRLLAAFVGVLLAGVLWLAWKERRYQLLAVVAVAFALYIAEVFVGASNIWFTLPAELRAAHLALAAAVWATLIAGGAWVFVEARAGARA
jgi:cytochrome c oxidase assembly protein subunit 15